eukprot:14740420-Heterocapsa_arctica.AAC.1
MARVNPKSYARVTHAILPAINIPSEAGNRILPAEGPGGPGQMPTPGRASEDQSQTELGQGATFLSFRPGLVFP